MVNQNRLVRMVYVLCAVIVLFCLYAWITPKSILDSTRRALLADVVRPTNTRLVNIKPGDDPERNRVVAGTHVPVLGRGPGDPARGRDLALQHRRRPVLRRATDDGRRAAV